MLQINGLKGSVRVMSYKPVVARIIGVLPSRTLGGVLRLADNLSVFYLVVRHLKPEVFHLESREKICVQRYLVAVRTSECKSCKGRTALIYLFAYT